MSGIIIIKSTNFNKFTDKMILAAREVFAEFDLTYGEAMVPYPTDIPVAISQNLETGNFFGVLALGCVHVEGEDIGYTHIYRETVHQLMEFSSYYTIPLGMGVCLTNKKTTVTDTVNFAKIAAYSVASMVNHSIKLSGFEADVYVGSNKHN